MCSIARGADTNDSATGDLAATIARMIDAVADAAGAPEDVECPDIAARLASAWAIIAAADPEIAARSARYSDL
jgi:hypothetical protein